MKINIYIISTVHKEKGNCTSENLFEILNKIKPDVIFCEVPLDMLESFTKGLIKSSLEFNSINELSKHHPFSIVAVDNYPRPSKDFRFKVEEIFDLMKNDKKHALAWRKNNNNTHLLGFKYLNSELSIEIFDEMSMREKAVITESNNMDYNNIYNKWLIFQNNRENDMLNNIFFYVENNELDNAVFLCGSAHRKSLLNKLKENRNTKLNWIYELPS